MCASERGAPGTRSRYIPDNSLQRAFSYCILYFYSSQRDLLEIQCAASMFGWRVATHYPLLLGSRMRDEAGAHNVAGSDAFGGVGVCCS